MKSLISKFRIQSTAGRQFVWLLTMAVLGLYLVNAIGWIAQNELWRAENWEGVGFRGLWYLLGAPLLLFLLPPVFGRSVEWLIAWMPISNLTARRWAGGIGGGQVCLFFLYATVVGGGGPIGTSAGVSCLNG